MIEEIINYLECEICKGELFLDLNKSADEYSIITEALDPEEAIDKLITKDLIYVCLECGHTHKLTYRDIERNIRRILSEKVLLLMAQGNISQNFSIQDKFYVYCGKCSGLDGKGSCPPNVYKKCDIKRFPINEL